MAKWLIFLVLCAIISNIHADLAVVNGKIKITVVTTAGCGDTVWFIGNHLAETYAEYKDFLEVEFVPWGRTVRNTDGSLLCQFGVNDCWANRVNRCALDLLKGNQDAQVEYMVCEFTVPRPAWSGNYQCAQAAGLNLIELDYCISSSVGDTLDAAAEAASAQPMTIINFVPAIVFNDEIDVDLHLSGFQRLKSVVCFALSEDPSTGVTNCQI